MSNQATRQISIFINGNEVNNTIKSIAAEQRKLTNEIANTTRGTAEYEAQALELRRINGIIAQHREGVSGIGQGYSLAKKGLDSFIGIAAGAFAVDTLLSYGKELFNTAVRLDSVEKKARTVFGEALPGITRAAEENAAAMGLTNAEYLQAASNIQDLLVPMGFQRQQAADITEQLVNLSGALSEWSGGQRTSKEVSETLSKALLGERDELKGLGISISQADLDARLLADGLNKLTGNSLKQAEAATTLKLIMEQSTDAQNQYAQGTGSLARQQAEAAAKLANIGEKLSTLLLPVFNGLLDLAGDLGDGLLGVVEGIDGLINPAKAATKAFDEQAAKVDDLTTNISPLLTRYEELTGKSELSKKEQDELKKIIEKVSAVIPTAIAGFGKYGEALALNTEEAKKFIETEKARLQFVNKIAIEETQIQIDEATKRAANSKRILDAGQVFKQQRSLTGIGGTVGEVEKLTGEEIKKLTEEVSKFQKEVDGATAELKRLKGEADEPPKNKPVTPTGGGSPAADSGDQDKLKKQLEDLFEKTASLRADLLAKQQDDELALTIHGIEKKYESELALATDLEKKGFKAATAQRIALEELRQQEIGLAVESYTEKAIADAEKQATEIEKARYEAAQKEAEAGQKFLDERQKEREAVQEQVDQFKAENLLSKEQQELLDLENQYQKLLLLADDYFNKDLDLKQAYEAKKKSITEKYQEEESKAKAEKDRKDTEAELEVQKIRLSAIGDGIQALAGYLEEGSGLQKAAFAFQKVVAAAEIIVNLQLETSKNSLFGATLGPIGAAAAAAQNFAARIRAGIALAAIAATSVQAFSGPPKTKQKARGGYLVTGADDGYTYDATFLGSPNTGMLPGYPVLLHSRATGGPVLASERGAEYFVAAHDLTNPSVMRHVRMIENITGAARGGIQQFADGGVVTPTTSTAPVANPQAQLDIAALNSTLSLLNTLLQRGIIAVVPDQSVIGIVDRYNKINTASGGYLNS